MKREDVYKILEESESDKEIFNAIRLYLGKWDNEVQEKITLYGPEDLEELTQLEEELDQLCDAGLMYFKKGGAYGSYLRDKKKEILIHFLKAGSHIFTNDYYAKKYSCLGSILDWSWFSADTQDVIRDLDRFVVSLPGYIYKGPEEKEELKEMRKRLEEIVEWAALNGYVEYIPMIEAVEGLLRIVEDGKL